MCISSPIAVVSPSQPPTFFETEVGIEIGELGYIAETPANPQIKSAQRTKMGDL